MTKTCVLMAGALAAGCVCTGQFGAAENEPGATGGVAAAYLPPPSQARAEVKWTRAICVEDDRYIGWPTVCRLANGDVVAVFSGDRDWHICPWGKVQIVRSEDDGETWSDPVTIANGPIDDRDAGVVQLPDGEVVVTYFTSVAYRKYMDKRPDYRRHDEKISDEVRAAALGVWSVRSRDNGRTWSRPEKQSVVGQSPHGPVLLKDGSLFQLGRVFAPDAGAEETGRTYITAERSRDGGRTWQTTAAEIPCAPGEAGPRMFFEPHAVELEDGTIVGMVRYHGKDNCMRETVSKDGGATWTTMAKTSLVGLPPHLLRIGGGRIVCAYGRRVQDAGIGEFAAISDDGGRTWDVENEICLARGDNWDLGYPSSCLLANGDILTVYYQQSEPGAKNCLMATRWRIKP